MFISSVVLILILFVIIEHNLVVFSRFVLNVFEVVEARTVLKMFFFFGPIIEARCSYKINLITKKAGISSSS